MGSKKLSRSESTIINLITSVIAWGWPMLLALVVTPLLVHGLGEDAYGMRGLIFTIMGYFALMDLGLNTAGTKYLAEYIAINDSDSVRELLGTTLLVYLIGGLIGCGVIWLTSSWLILSIFKIPLALQQESIWSFRIAGLGFFLSMLTWWGTSIPSGLQRFDVSNWISVGFGTVTSLSSLAAVLLGQGLIGVIWASVFANFLTVIAYWISIKRLLPGVTIHPSFSWKMFKRTTLFGLWGILFRVVGVSVTQLDRILIAMWLGPAAVTYFLVSRRVASPVHQINAKMLQVVFPMASEFSATASSEKLQHLFLRSMNLSIVVAIGMALPIFVLAQPFMTYWMSEEFALHTAELVRILTLCFCLTAQTAAPSAILPGMGYPQVPFIAAVLSSMVLLPGYFLLIRPLGIVGAGWAYMASCILVLAFYAIVSVRKIKVSPARLMQSVLKPLISALVIGYIVDVFAVPLVKNLFTVLLVGAGMGGVYGVAVWFGGVFDDNEKRTLKTFILKRMSLPLKGGR